mgnify:CR=1 FL=1|tara:strand:- start:1328 stop:2089 length:762 start_codon:yes stop_codon:yes gene_type:complete
MNWWSIIKQMDYNQLDSSKKELIKRAMLTDYGFDLNIDEFTSEFPIYSTEMYYSDIDKEYEVGFPDYFRFAAIGDLDIRDETLMGHIDFFIENTKNPRESYFIGYIDVDKELDDEVMDFLDKYGEDFDTLRDLMLLPDFKEETRLNFVFTKEPDYNKLVEYLKESGKWEREDLAEKIGEETGNKRGNQNKEIVDDLDDFQTQYYENEYTDPKTNQELEALTVAISNGDTKNLERRFPEAYLIFGEADLLGDLT